MTNIFLNTINFLTVQEYRDSTTTQLSNSDIQVVIYKAETSLKNYLGYEIEKTDDNEQDLKEATFYIAKQLEVNKDTITRANQGLKSEATGDRSYTVGDMTTDDILKINGINQEAKAILNKYRNIFYKQVI